jgi:predicted nucleic acid-binding protein
LIAIDTNILVYAEGLRRTEADEVKITQAKILVEEWSLSKKVVIAAQVCAELHSVLVRYLRLSPSAAGERVSEFLTLFDCAPTTESILAQAFTLAARHKTQTYDAIILAAAAESGCDTLYSEDMQHGFVWRGVEVINPFL